MFGGIVFWQSDTNGEDLDPENNTRNFLDVVIAPSPSLNAIVEASLLRTDIRIQPAKDLWAKEDANQ